MVDGLDMDGKPLMPTQRHGKVRHLLKEERKAKVVKKIHLPSSFYTIQQDIPSPPLLE